QEQRQTQEGDEENGQQPGGGGAGAATLGDITDGDDLDRVVHDQTDGLPGFQVDGDVHTRAIPPRLYRVIDDHRCVVRGTFTAAFLHIDEGVVGGEYWGGQLEVDAHALALEETRTLVIPVGEGAGAGAGFGQAHLDQLLEGGALRFGDMRVALEGGDVPDILVG